MSNRHNVFVSYHHALGESYKKPFERRFSLFAAIRDWSEANDTGRKVIHQAYLPKSTILTGNSRTPFNKNCTCTELTD